MFEAFILGCIAAIVIIGSALFASIKNHSYDDWSKKNY